MQISLRFFFFAAALFTAVVTGAGGAQQDAQPEMMLPVVRIEASGNPWVAVWGLFAEGGEFMSLGRELLPADSHPILSGEQENAVWIEAEKLRELRRLVPGCDLHFRFGPEWIEWKNKRWVRVRSDKPPRNPGALALANFPRIGPDELRRDKKS